MKKKIALGASLLLFGLLLAACTAGPAATEEAMAAETTPTSLPEPTATATDVPLPSYSFNVLQQSTRDDRALVDPDGSDWEGNYSWSPYVVLDGGTYYLFYNGFTSKASGVGLATSTDGFHFERAATNPILEPKDQYTMAIGPVVYQADDGNWVMFLVEDSHRSNLAGANVVRYTAPEPAGPWTASNDGEPVYSAEEGDWNDRMVVRSIAFVGDEIWLAFHARHANSTADIGILVSSDGGMHFELLVDGPVLSPGEREEWDGYAVGSPVLFANEDGFEMFYLGLVPNQGFLTSYIAGNYFFGYATSPDGIHWDKAPNNPVIQIPEGGGFSYSSGMKVGDTYYIYYVYDAGRFGLGALSLTIDGAE